MQVVEDGRGCFLDVLVGLVIFKNVVDVVVMIDFDLVQVVRGYQVVQWYFEYFGYFVGLWYWYEFWIDYCYYWCDVVVGDGDEGIEIFQCLYLVGC